MVEELLDGVALFRIDGEEVGDEILRRLGDFVPPGRQESVLSASDFFRQDLDRFVVEGWEAAE